MTRKPPTMSAERVALRILAGCPNGATVEALAANGVTPNTMARLLAAGHAGARRHYVVNVGRVWWLFITGAGLDLLQSNQVQS